MARKNLCRLVKSLAIVSCIVFMATGIRCMSSPAVAPAAEEIWFHVPEETFFKLKLRWTVYEDSYQIRVPAHRLQYWSEYVEKKRLEGSILLLDEKGRTVYSVPLDFKSFPNGTSVDITVSEPLGSLQAVKKIMPGFYRVVTSGAESVPVQIVVEDVFPENIKWGLPLDRGFLFGGEEFFFRVPEETAKLNIRSILLPPWEKEKVSVFDDKGDLAREENQGGSLLELEVKVPPESAGRVWSIMFSGTAGKLLRIKGVDMVSAKRDAIFLPAKVPPPSPSLSLPYPAGFAGKIVSLPAGKSYSVPRGEKTGEHAYSHVNVKQGTIEFWMRLDANEENLFSLTLLRFGDMRIYHRGLGGIYLNMGKGFLQSGFIFRPGKWYHVAVAWDMGPGNTETYLNLFVDGVSMLGTVMSPLPADTGDWTAGKLVIGGGQAFSMGGLRISSVNRSEDLQKGILSPAPDKNTLYMQAVSSE